MGRLSKDTHPFSLSMDGVSTPDLNDVNSLEKIATMIESTTGVRGLYKKISELLPELNLSPEKLQLVSLYRKMNSANKYRISAFIDLLLNDQGTPRTVGEKMNSLRDFLGMTLDAHQTHIPSFDSSRIHKMVIPTEVFDAMYNLFLLGAYWTDLDAADVTIVQQRLVEMRNTAVNYTKKAESQRGIYV